MQQRWLRSARGSGAEPGKARFGRAIVAILIVARRSAGIPVCSGAEGIGAPGPCEMAPFAKDKLRRPQQPSAPRSYRVPRRPPRMTTPRPRSRRPRLHRRFSAVGASTCARVTAASVASPSGKAPWPPCALLHRCRLSRRSGSSAQSHQLPVAITSVPAPLWIWHPFPGQWPPLLRVPAPVCGCWSLSRLAFGALGPQHQSQTYSWRSPCRLACRPMQGTTAAQSRPTSKEGTPACKEI